MARFEIEGMLDLSSRFDALIDLPDEVTDEMLEKMGDVVVREQKQTASAMLQGPYNKGGVAGAITKGKVKRIGDGKSLSIDFVGTQHGESLSRIAYINEYGKTNQPARPFIATANAKAENEAVEKAASVLFNHYSRKGL